VGDEDLRDLFAAFAMLGQIVKRGTIEPETAYELADAMIEAKYYKEPEEPEVGITAIKTKRKTAKE
jgi:hypothetical protein